MPILHRDIKNVDNLLDDGYTVKVINRNMHCCFKNDGSKSYFNFHC